jgi:hypothetical protein
MFWGFSLSMATHFSRTVVIHHRILYERVQIWKSGCKLLCRLPRAFEWLNYVQQKLQTLHEFTMWIPVVTICTIRLTVTNSTFCPHSVFMCFVWIWEQTAIIALSRSTKQEVFSNCKSLSRNLVSGRKNYCNAHDWTHWKEEISENLTRCIWNHKGGLVEPVLSKLIRIIG